MFKRFVKKIFISTQWIFLHVVNIKQCILKKNYNSSVVNGFINQIPFCGLFLVNINVRNLLLSLVDKVTISKLTQAKLRAKRSIFDKSD